jgi:zinc and cadmium transporter
MLALSLALLATFFISALSLVGILIVRWSERVEVYFLSFAAGVLLGTTFLDLLPEAVAKSGGDGDIFTAALAAMIGFFLLERLLHGFHVHEDSHAVASGYLILIGDGLHNFIDGVVIAASFIVGPELGATTTLAVAAHEIPQEIADYGILVSGKFSRRAALLLNFLSGLTAMLGAAVCFAFQETVERHIGWFMTATAGMFIYIAASDLIPELHHTRRRGSWLHTLPFLGGVVLIAVLVALVPG